MSYLEVYNEKIIDLLDQSNEDIKIQTTKQGELRLIGRFRCGLLILKRDLFLIKLILPVRKYLIYLLGLKKYGVEKFDEFRDIFTAANEKRSVASTKLNNESSRSHR